MTMHQGHDRVSPFIQAQADAWWLRLRSGSVTREDGRAFLDWKGQSPAHARAWNELARTWQALGAAAERIEEEAPWTRDPQHVARQTERINTRRRRLVGGAMAASVAGVMALKPPLGLWPSIVDLAADQRTATGEQREITLSPYALVRMNTQTRVNLRVSQGQVDWVELLGGEIEADANGARLTVLAAGARLGMELGRFNVRRTGTDVCVTCLQGRLLVEHRDMRRELPAGAQAWFDRERIRSVSEANLTQVSAWRSGTLSFVDVPLSEVIDEINRYRPGRIIVRDPSLAARSVRLRVRIDQTENALKMIRDLYQASYRELPGGIVLLG